jgi:hypothetical protein
MHAIKATYDHGKISLLEPMPEGIEKATLTIVVEEDGDEPHVSVPAGQLQPVKQDAERDFQALGAANFMNEPSDAGVDWEDFFGLKS